MKNKQANQVKNKNSGTTSISPVFNVYQFIKDLNNLMTKYREKQAECLDGSPMDQETPVDLLKSNNQIQKLQQQTKPSQNQINSEKSLS